MSGSDAGSYTKPGNNNIQIVGNYDKAPIIASLTVTDYTKYTATFKINTSTIGTLYYQVRLKGSKAPAPENILESYRLGEASRMNLLSKSLINSFTIDGLAAETIYVLFCTFVDSYSNLSELSSVDFNTEKDHQSVLFYITFESLNSLTQRTQDYFDKQITPAVAKAMAVHPTRVHLQLISAGRRLQSDTNTIPCYVASDKYVEMISPETIVDSLSVSTLNLYVSVLDLKVTKITDPITLSNSGPDWLDIGAVWSVTNSSITASGITVNDGYLHIIALEKGSAKPSSQQVVWGVDGENNYATHASAFAEASKRAYAIITGLDNDTEYDVYIAASNNNPGNNKAVTTSVISYLKVRTSIENSCIDCPLYIIADNLSVRVIPTVLFLFLIVI